MTDTFTTAQAAYVMGERLRAFKKVVERAPVKPKMVNRGGRRIRQFHFFDLVFLHAYNELKADYTAKSQAELYEALGAVVVRGSRVREVAFGDHKYDFHRHLMVVQAKVRELDDLTTMIDATGRIRGTDIEAHRIAALLDAMSEEEILGDYPSLDDRQLLASKAYAEANPKPGRPYPRITAKKAMREADLGEIDDYFAELR
ncbi:MAG: DUF433 domain-containing protein [Phenylobacterium sp.]|uniref:DUF433 domain-containing protein n=1 Tax=Phenylobacterium sp. TaxID=1871053 RepID=UPI0027329CEF|nr:DUF433 domain-containing protein [Phenylobacterium sp.]MDP3749691.1 DUF433 domain-containing protein [Phenylobacterium sp.]